MLFTMEQGRAQYLASVESCLVSIREGESYQVCLTNELSCSAGLNPLEVYRTMRRINPRGLKTLLTRRIFKAREDTESLPTLPCKYSRKIF